MKKIKVALLDDDKGAGNEAVNDFIVEEKNVCRMKECVAKGSCSHVNRMDLYAFSYNEGKVTSSNDIPFTSLGSES